ncbi:MAG: hypothetical protein OEZ02_04785 [Anaerolineae bacterium]|nr:hypothetical protein [Anaerolineae bacterium]
MKKKSKLDWMLWQVEDGYQNDPPQANLIRAIQHYNEKYGAVPNRCEVPPAWENRLKVPNGMLLAASKKVRPNHFMLTLDPDLELPGLFGLPFRSSAV